MTIKIKTQKDLEKYLKKGERDFEFVAGGVFEINWKEKVSVKVAAELRFDVKIFAWGSSSVVARGSSSVVAWGSSSVVAWESSSVVAWGSSSVVARGSSSVVAWESSRVEARESSSVVARGSSSVVAWESSSVVAWESSSVVARESSSVVAWGSSRVEARESSSVVARGSSSVVARESSSVVARESSRVEAWGFVSLVLWNKAVAKLSAKCHAFIHSTDAKAEGGIQTKAVLTTGKDWCEYYGVKVERGLARVYKGLGKGFSSKHDHSFKYVPGTKPKAPKFDHQECSYGLHFSPHPRMTHQFVSDPAHYVECWVRVKDMLVFFNGSFPTKCKAPEVIRPVIEVDVDANPIQTDEKVAA